MNWEAEQIMTLAHQRAIKVGVSAAAFPFAITDLEDGVQLAAARAFQADAIVTRDQKGFRAAEVPVFSPPAFLEYWINLQP